MEKGYEYEDAGLASVEEALKRLIDGEVFYYVYEGKINTIKYEKHVNEKGGMPTVTRWVTLDVLLLFKFKGWKTRKEVKKQWCDGLGNGVLCWCWDYDEDDRVLALILKYAPTQKFPFIGKDWCYEKATPATAEEINNYILKD